MSGDNGVNNDGSTMKTAKVLSLYELFGGFIGLGVAIYGLFHLLLHYGEIASPITSLTIILFLLMFFGIAVLAGIWLWRMKGLGKNLSVMLFALQVPIFKIISFQYFISLGLALIAIARSGEKGTFIGFNFNLLPEISLGYVYTETLIGINITPIILLIVLRGVQVD
jgi:hypothetical protein